MRNKILYTLIGSLMLFGLIGCGGANSNTAYNSNSNMNSNRSVTNSIGNAVNTVTNTVSNMTNTSSASNATDFMTEAAQGGMAEVQLGKLAVSKAQNAEVKKFGQMMVDDHT